MIRKDRREKTLDARLLSAALFVAVARVVVAVLAMRVMGRAGQTESLSVVHDGPETFFLLGRLIRGVLAVGLRQRARFSLDIAKGVEGQTGNGQEDKQRALRRGNEVHRVKSEGWISRFIVGTGIRQASFFH
jgi:hypothetical protein